MINDIKLKIISAIKKFILISLGCIILYFGTIIGWYMLTMKTFETTLGDKVQVATTNKAIGDLENKKMIYSFEDNLYIGHFNSAALFASTQRNHRYIITTTGIRIPLFSMMPNIINVIEVKNND